MGKRKKKQIHCVETGLPCDWYRKGKNHRVLVRADGKVIANNPLPLAALALTAAPTVIEKGKEFLGGGTKSEQPGEAPEISAQRLRNRYTTEERVRDALRS